MSPYTKHHCINDRTCFCLVFILKSIFCFIHADSLTKENKDLNINGNNIIKNLNIIIIINKCMKVLLTYNSLLSLRDKEIVIRRSAPCRTVPGSSPGTGHSVRCDSISQRRDDVCPMHTPAGCTHNAQDL